jgi:hypothetical protein
MEVNQILMMPLSFGGWQAHDDDDVNFKDDSICYYTRCDTNAYIYFLLVLPLMSGFDTNEHLRDEPI